MHRLLSGSAVGLLTGIALAALAIVGPVGLAAAQGAGGNAPPAERASADPALQVTRSPSTAGSTPVDAADGRRRLVDRLLLELPYPLRLGTIRRYVDAGRWFSALQRELKRGTDKRFSFRCFLTPGVEDAGITREHPFDLAETLRRVWKGATWRCVGELPGNRLVYEAKRPLRAPDGDGDASREDDDDADADVETETWRVVFWFARELRGHWMITRIDDRKHLTFCLVEDRRGLARRWRILPPQAAGDACRFGDEPEVGLTITRGDFQPMGLPDPLKAPFLWIERIDLARGKAFVGSFYEGGVRVGERIRCYAQRPYRLVAMDEHRIVLQNWARYRFTVDLRTQKMQPDDPDFVMLGNGSTNSGRQMDGGEPDDEDTDEQDGDDDSDDR